MNNSTLSLTDTNLRIQHLVEELERVKTGADIAWTNSNGYIIFFMQVGFCLLESGSSRHKHHLSTIFLQILCGFASIFGWWILGYSFAYGENKGNFIGASHFGGDKVYLSAETLAEWIFDMGSATTAAKIVSGSMIERVTPSAYFFFCIFMGAWIYPVGIHWGWHPSGWLKKLGYIDHAGSGIVHMVGGASALAGCILIGSRMFRFEKKNEDEDAILKRKLHNHKNFEAHFISYSAVGTLLLVYCWFGFNCGSTHASVSTDQTDNSINIGLVGVNTIIATCAGGISSLIIQVIIYKTTKNSEFKYNIGFLCNGLLSGAVAITAGCSTVYPYAAFIIGFIAGFVYFFYQWLIHLFHLDDPLHASPIHLGTGSWGVAAVGIFHFEKGFLYGGGGMLFGVQLLGMVCYFAWSFIFAFVFFYVFKVFGWLRLTEEEELKGDIVGYGVYMFNYDEETLKYYSQIFSSTSRGTCFDFKENNEMVHMGTVSNRNLVVVTENIHINSKENEKEKMSIKEE